MSPLELNYAIYQGRKLTFSYELGYHYRPVVSYEDAGGFGVSFIKTAFPAPVRKTFVGTVGEEWLKSPRLFGILRGGSPIAFLEVDHEAWNNRLRVTNIWVDEAYRRHGAGSALLGAAFDCAVQAGARALVLDTQNCNEPAISFYLKNSLSFIGCDLLAYSNQDVENGEVRLELGAVIPRMKEVSESFTELPGLRKITAYIFHCPL